MEEKRFGNNDIIRFLEDTRDFLKEELRKDKRNLYLMGYVSAMESTLKELERIKYFDENVVGVEVNVRAGIPYLNSAAKLEALAEEASELSKAALKLARIHRNENPTPVTKEKAIDNLNEEIADVLVCVRSLREVSPEKIKEISDNKLARWIGRLKERYRNK